MWVLWVLYDTLVCVENLALLIKEALFFTPLLVVGGDRKVNAILWYSVLCDYVREKFAVSKKRYTMV